MNYLTFKNLLDKTFAFILLIFLLPIFILIGITIKMDSSGEIFYKQDRIGLNGKRFLIYKFRTMKKNNGNLRTKPNDDRITKIGHKLRKSSIDELPQLINVLRGEMSFIGPRPDVYANYFKYNNIQKYKLKVKPGISGYSQVKGRSNLTVQEKYVFDKYYVDNISFTLDLKIFLLTIKTILNKTGVN